MFRLPIVLVIVLIGAHADAQPLPKEGLDSLISHVAKNFRNDRRERIMVHADKSIYTIGETVWLKAYCLNALSQRPVRYSNTLFVDLVNNRDSMNAKEDYGYIRTIVSIRKPDYPKSIIYLPTPAPVVIWKDGDYYSPEEIFSKGYLAWLGKLANALPWDYDVNSPKE